MNPFVSEQLNAVSPELVLLVLGLAGVVAIVATVLRKSPRRCPHCGAQQGEVHKPRCVYPR